MDITLTLSSEKTRALLALIDLAVKKDGMAVAEMGVVLAHEIQSAVKAAQARLQTVDGKADVGLAS